MGVGRGGEEAAHALQRLPEESFPTLKCMSQTYETSAILYDHVVFRFQTHAHEFPAITEHLIMLPEKYIHGIHAFQVLKRKAEPHSICVPIPYIWLLLDSVHNSLHGDFERYSIEKAVSNLRFPATVPIWTEIVKEDNRADPIQRTFHLGDVNKVPSSRSTGSGREASLF